MTVQLRAGELLDNVHDMHDNFCDSDSEMPQYDAALAGTAGGAAAPAKSGARGLRGFFKVPEKRKPSKPMHADASGAKGQSAGGSGGVYCRLRRYALHTHETAPYQAVVEQCPVAHSMLSTLFGSAECSGG